MYDLLLKVGADASGISKAVLDQARIAENALKKVPLRLQTTSLGNGFKTLTADVERFDKSVSRMASVISTFGQAAAVVFGVQNALAAMVKTAIDVEKKMTDINVIFGATSSELQKFSSGLFNVARETSTAFNDVATAAQEFARQGLSAEETLKRTRDAMILVKISGSDVIGSVEALTAAINTFKGEVLDTTKVANTLANVDAAFAVSANDLAESIKRTGSAASDAKVSFNELLAATTALQQTTARGGSVIGNSLKSIFTRTSRSDSLELLESFGVQVKTLEGEVRPVLDVLKDLSQVFNSLSDAQKGQVKETLAGVYQINALSALLGDLSSKWSIYDQSLKTANATTDEAQVRIKLLKETTAATIQDSSTNLTQLAASFGKLATNSPIQGLLKMINKGLEPLANFEAGEGFSDKLLRGTAKGIGTFAGSGGAILGGRAAFNIGRLALEGVSDQLKAATTLSRSKEKELNLQEQIKGVLLSQDPLIQKQINSAATLGDKYARVLNILTSNTAAVLQLNNISASFSKAAVIEGFNPVVSAENQINRKGRRVKTFSKGFIPSLAMEQMAINKGTGGAPKGAKPVVIPNFSISPGRKETVVANSSEYIVPNFANSGASAVFNQDMVKKMGLPKGATKIMAGGYIPNFNTNYVFDSIKDFDPNNRLVSDSPERRSQLLKSGITPVRPDEIINLLEKSQSLVKITDPTGTLREELKAIAPHLLNKALITSVNTPLLNKFQETKIGAGLQPSVDIKEILKGDKSKLRPIDKISKYGKEKFGDSFFLKPFIGAQSDKVFNATELQKRKNLPAGTGYGGFFLQKGIPNIDPSGKEYRVHVAKIGKDAQVLGGVGSKFRQEGKVYSNPDFFRDPGAKKGVNFGERLSRSIAAMQAQRLVKSLPSEYSQSIAGIDVAATGNKGIKRLAQYFSEKFNLPFFKGGGAIEYNFSQKSVAGLQGGSSGGLIRADTLVAAANALKASSSINVSDFVKRGNIIAEMTGAEQASSFKNFYKDLTKLKSYDENAFFQIAKKLNETGNYGIDVGKAAQRQKLDKTSGARYLARRGFAGGYIPNFSRLGKAFGDYDKFRLQSNKIFGKMVPGTPLPTTSVSDLSKNKLFRKYFDASDAQGTKGVFDPSSNKILLSNKNSPLGNIRTYVHEMGHAAEDFLPANFKSKLGTAFEKDLLKGKTPAQLLFKDFKSSYSPKEEFSESFAEGVANIFTGVGKDKAKKSLMLRYMRRSISKGLKGGLSGGFIPNLASLRFGRFNKMDDSPISKISRQIKDKDTGSYLKFKAFNDSLDIDMIESKKKGDAFKLFNKLVKYGQKSGRRTINSTSLTAQNRNMSKSILEKDGPLAAFYNAFPQVRYRKQDKLKTSGNLVFPSGKSEDFKSKRFNSIKDLEKLVSSEKFAEIIKKYLPKGKIDLYGLKTNFAGGFIPNFSKAPLDASIQREAVALNKLGYSQSEIFKSLRVQSSARLKGTDNPEGLAVFNTLQGQNNIGKALSDHRNENIKKSGMVPNFATASSIKTPGFLGQDFKELKGILGNIQSGGGVSNISTGVVSSALGSIGQSGPAAGTDQEKRILNKTMEKLSGVLNQEINSTEAKLKVLKPNTDAYKKQSKTLDFLTRAQNEVGKMYQKNMQLGNKPNIQSAVAGYIGRQNQAAGGMMVAGGSNNGSKGAALGKLGGFASKYSLPIAFAAPTAMSIMGEFAGQKDSGMSRFNQVAAPAISGAAALASFGPYGMLAGAGLAGYGVYKGLDASKEKFSGQFGSLKRFENEENKRQITQQKFGQLGQSLLDVETLKGKPGSEKQLISLIKESAGSISGVGSPTQSSDLRDLLSSDDSIESKLEKLREIQFGVTQDQTRKTNRAGVDVVLDKVAKGEKKINDKEVQDELVSLISGSVDLNNLPKNFRKNLESGQFNSGPDDIFSFVGNAALGNDSLQAANTKGADLSALNNSLVAKFKDLIKFNESVDSVLVKLQQSSRFSRDVNIKNLSNSLSSSLAISDTARDNKRSLLGQRLSDSDASNSTKLVLGGKIESDKIISANQTSASQQGISAIEILRNIAPGKNSSQIDSLISKLGTSIQERDVEGIQSAISNSALLDIDKESVSQLRSIYSELQKNNGITAQQLSATRDQVKLGLKQEMKESSINFLELFKNPDFFKNLGKSFSNSSEAQDSINRETGKPNTGDPDKESARKALIFSEKVKKDQAEYDILSGDMALGADNYNAVRNKFGQADSVEGLRLETEKYEASLQEKSASALPIVKNKVTNDAIKGATDLFSGFNFSSELTRTSGKDIEQANATLQSGDLNSIRELFSNGKFIEKLKGNISQLGNTRGKDTLIAAQNEVGQLENLLKRGDQILDPNRINDAAKVQTDKLVGEPVDSSDLKALFKIDESINELQTISEKTTSNTEKIAALIAASLSNSEKSKVIQEGISAQGDAKSNLSKAEAQKQALEAQFLEDQRSLVGTENFNRIPEQTRKKIYDGVSKGLNFEDLTNTLTPEERVQFESGQFEEIRTKSRAPGAFMGQTSYEDRTPFKIDLSKIIESLKGRDSNSLPVLEEQVSKAKQSYIETISKNPVALQSRELAIGNIFNERLATAPGIGQKSEFINRPKIGDKEAQDFVAQVPKINDFTDLEGRQSGIASQTDTLTNFIKSALNTSGSALSYEQLQGVQNFAVSRSSAISSSNSEGGQAITNTEFSDFASQFISTINNAIKSNNDAANASPTKPVENNTSASTDAASKLETVINKGIKQTIEIVINGQVAQVFDSGSISEIQKQVTQGVIDSINKNNVVMSGSGKNVMNIS